MGHGAQWPPWGMRHAAWGMAMAAQSHVTSFSRHVTSFSRGTCVGQVAGGVVLVGSSDKCCRAWRLARSIAYLLTATPGASPGPSWLSPEGGGVRRGYRLIVELLGKHLPSASTCLDPFDSAGLVTQRVGA